MHQKQFQKIARKYLCAKCEIIAENETLYWERNRNIYLKVNFKVDIL